MPIPASTHSDPEANRMTKLPRSGKSKHQTSDRKPQHNLH